MSAADDVRLRPVDQDLKVDSNTLIAAYGGQVPVAALLGRSQSRYSDAGSRNTRVFLTIAEVGELEDRTVGTAGHPVVTRGLARRQGYELTALPAALPVGPDLVPFVGKLAKEFGEASAAACNTACGSDVRARAAEAEREFDDLILVAVTMRAAMRAIKLGDG